jgi:hypothetical protein
MKLLTGPSPAIRRYEVLDGQVVHYVGSSELICTSHALNRMRERNIPTEAILRTLSQPNRIRWKLNARGVGTLLFYRRTRSRSKSIIIAVVFVNGRSLITTVYNGAHDSHLR